MTAFSKCPSVVLRATPMAEPDSCMRGFRGRSLVTFVADVFWRGPSEWLKIESKRSCPSLRVATHHALGIGTLYQPARAKFVRSTSSRFGGPCARSDLNIWLLAVSSARTSVTSLTLIRFSVHEGSVARWLVELWDKFRSSPACDDRRERSSTTPVLRTGGYREREREDILSLSN